jgi:hypothetical protein
MITIWIAILIVTRFTVSYKFFFRNQSFLEVWPQSWNVVCAILAASALSYYQNWGYWSLLALPFIYLVFAAISYEWKKHIKNGERILKERAAKKANH